METKYEPKTIDEYEKMGISYLLDMRYGKDTPIDELHKILKALSKVYPAGTTPCRQWDF